MKFVLIVLSIILCGCAAPGETLSKNLWVAEYEHTHGKKPKLRANLHKNIKFRPKFDKGSLSFDEAQLIVKIPIDPDFSINN